MTTLFMAMLADQAQLKSYDSTFYNFGTGDFTICIMPRIATAGTLLAYQGSAANDGYTITADSAGAVHFNIWSGGAQTTISTNAGALPSASQCHCLAIVRSSGNISILVDFLPATLTTGGTSVAFGGNIGVNAPAPLILGQPSGAGFVGGLMNAGIWTEELSGSALQQAGFGITEPVATAMAGYWTLDQTTDDLSSNQNPLTIVGRVTYRQCLDCIWTHGENDYRFLQMQSTPDTPPQIVAADDVEIDAVVMMAETRPLHVPDNSPAVFVTLMGAETGLVAPPANAHFTLTDPDGIVYDTDQSTDTVFVQVIDGVTVAAVVNNPKAGEWQIALASSPSQPVFMQAQAVPSADVVTTATDALTPLFGVPGARPVLFHSDSELSVMGFWSIVGKIAVAAVAGVIAAGVVVASGGTALPAVAAGVVAFASVSLAESMASVETMSPEYPTNSVQTGGLSGFIVANASMLLIDANVAADRATQIIYKQRKKKLYPAVNASGFKTKQSSIIGDQDKRANVKPALEGLGNGYVSASGHGLPNYLTGWYVSGNDGPLEEVLTKGKFSTAEATGKIFHFFACNTGKANGLGQALVAAGAVAFFGYNKPYVVEVSLENVPKFCTPDIEIDKQLVIGKTCDEAYTASIAVFNTNISRLKADGDTSAAALLEGNRDALMCPSNDSNMGNKNAKLAAGTD